MMFGQDSGAAFAKNYPEKAVRLRHGLSENAAFSQESLIDLTRELDPAAVEYNAADLPVSQSPDDVPQNGLSAEDTVRQIESCRSWLVLKNIERHPHYRDILEECIAEISGFPEMKRRDMFKPEGFIFISSPGAVTPFHMDPEHNILVQISGTKTMRLLTRGKNIVVSPEQHEKFHGAGGHRNLPHCRSHDTLSTPHTLAPGDALYVPVKAPHWVKVGEEPSVSLSITWRTRLSDREAHLHKANAFLRARGAEPPVAGASPARDYVKAFAHRVATRIMRA